MTDDLLRQRLGRYLRSVRCSSCGDWLCPNDDAAAITAGTLIEQYGVQRVRNEFAGVIGLQCDRCRYSGNGDKMGISE